MSGNQSRREFLQFVGRSASASLIAPSALGWLSLSTTGCQTSSKKQVGLFEGLSPSFKDDFVLAPGLNYHIVAKAGDTLNAKGEQFGQCADFTTFVPFKNQKHEGILWVNHESTIPQFVHNLSTKDLKRTREEILKEQLTVGGSLMHVKKFKGQWKVQKGSKYNRRISAQTQIPFSHNTKIMGTRSSYGTIANCAGGQTPWRTILSSEENYNNFYGDVEYSKGRRSYRPSDKHGWEKHFPLPPEHYGWVVEVNPFSGRAKKQILLGRASHEGATVAMTRKKKAVVYMGEDRPGGFIFKFVSTGGHLNDGTLYAANTEKGQWLPLDIDKDPKLKKHFGSQLEVLTYSHLAAETVGATPQDRPEDVQIDPLTNHIYIALTKGVKGDARFGRLLKLEESYDFDSLEFNAKVWISGGPETGFSCPDNLAFDNLGNLWMTVDMSNKQVGQGPFKPFGNNGLYYIPLRGPKAGIAVQVASSPNEAELTGPWFSPDYKTLFLSVQHPGIGTRKDLSNPTSQWPNGPGKQPCSAVVAIQGDRLENLTNKASSIWS